MANQNCEHIDGIKTIKRPKTQECAECVKIGASWVHLRTCQTCGVTLCCDTSPNHHATKHAKATGHPVIASAEPGERWLYCYPDDLFVEYYCLFLWGGSNASDDIERVAAMSLDVPERLPKMRNVRLILIE